MSLPTIKQLRYFVALEKYRHFGRAAKSCFVSQSAFSTAIKELESLLDVQLVDRSNQQVTITHTGQDVAVQARLCLRDLEGLVELAAENRDDLNGSLRLGVIPTIAPFLLPRLLPELGKTYPDLKLYLDEDTTANIYQKLMSGELDVILLALPYELRSVETMTLFRDAFLLASRRDSTWVDPDRFVLQSMAAESIFLLEDGHCLRDHALTACRIRDGQKISPWSASSMLTLIEMVDADLGVTFLPEMALGSPLLKSTRLELTRLDEESFREIGLVWRASSGRGNAFRELGEFMVSHWQSRTTHASP